MTLFADLFPSGRGRPSIPGDVVASVMVLQALEGLSDREAERALRDRISWKVATGLPIDSDRVRLFGADLLADTVAAQRPPGADLRRGARGRRGDGGVGGQDPRALDSTLFDDAVATQDTVTQLIAAIRRVRRLVPEAAGGRARAPTTTTVPPSRRSCGTTRSPSRR